VRGQRTSGEFIEKSDANPDDLNVGLVNCFYRLANPTTLAMQWEAIAINADFWSQVLQSASFRKLDFALGAIMAVRRQSLSEIGGFKALANCLADDYQLGKRIAQRGHRIELCPVVVECWSPPMGWREVWKHQLRWARTIRVCQPLPYFFSVLNNVTFWSLAWIAAAGAVPTFENRTLATGGFVGSFSVPWELFAAMSCVLVRIVAAVDLQRRLAPMGAHQIYFWLLPLKDLLQFALWVGAFLGNQIEWRGQRYRLRHDGTLLPR
jgi:ceramide glucosyltransferase